MDTDRFDLSRFNVKLLSTSNYFMWANKMEIILRGKGLWDIVMGDEREPDEEDDDAVKKFKRLKDMTVTYLLMSIEEGCLPTVISMRDPKEIWSKLEETYQKISKASIDAYLVQYQQIKMRNSEKIMEYVNRLQELENKLTEIGEAVSDDEKRRALLRGLRAEFAVTSEVIRGTDKSVTDAISQLLVFEASQIQEGCDDVDDGAKDGIVKALTASGQKSCDHCGRPGHVKNTCFHNPASKYYRKQGSWKSRMYHKEDNEDESAINAAIML